MKAPLAILALTTVLLAGCASTPTAAPTTPPPVNDYTAPPQGPATPTQAAPAAPDGHAVGEAVKVDMGGGNVAQITIASASYVPTIGSGSFPGPAKKGGYLVLEVTWETVQGTTSPNPFFFNMKDGATHTGSLAVGTGDDLHSTPIAAGDKVTGKVAQDIGAGPWRVTMIGSAQAVFWNVPA